MPENETTEFVALDVVHKLVRERTEALGGPTEAAKKWGCTLQMVSMVNAEKRRPTPPMLTDVGIEKIDTKIQYRRLPPEKAVS